MRETTRVVIATQKTPNTAEYLSENDETLNRVAMERGEMWDTHSLSNKGIPFPIGSTDVELQNNFYFRMRTLSNSR